MSAGPILLMVRTEVQQRRGSLVGLAAIIALVVAVVAAGSAGTRRTATVLDRFEDATETSDVDVFALSADLGSDPAQGVALAGALSRVEGVQAVSVAAGFPVDVLEDEYFMVSSSPDGSAFAEMDRPLVRSGRLPDADAPDEIAINRIAASALDLEIGDRVTGPTLTPEGVAASFTTGEFEGFVGPELSLEVVGIVTTGPELSGRLESATPRALASPAFAATYGDTVGSYVTDVGLQTVDTSPAQLRRITDVTQAEVGDFEIGVLTTADSWRDAARDTYRTLALTVGAFTAVALLAGMLVVLQAAARDVQQSTAQNRIASTLGMTRRERTVVTAGPTLLATIVGVIAGLALSVVGSVPFPIGRARNAETSPGLQVDATTILVAAALLAAVAAWVAWVAWRETGHDGHLARPSRSRIASQIANLGAPPAASVGIRMAYERGGGRTVMPVRSALIGAVVAVASVIAVIVVASSADAVAVEPTRYGAVWSSLPDILAEDSDAALEQAIGVEGVDSAAGLLFSTIEVGGTPVPAAAIDVAHGSMAFTQVAGRQPIEATEIALATPTAAELGVDIGDTLPIDDPSGGPAAAVKVVGTIVAPPIDDVPRTAVLSPEGLFAYAQSEPAIYPAFHYDPSVADQVERALEDLEFRFTASSFTPAPSEIEQVRAVRYLLIGLVALLGFLGAAGLLHFLGTSIRRRGGDLAVLQALGFLRRDVRWSVAWQAVAATAVGLLVGIPLGLIVGRAAWNRLVVHLAIVDDPAMPWALAVAVIGGALAGALILSTIPGRIAATRRPVKVLRAE